MKILIDTNVIIDVLNKRKDFFEDSFNTLQAVFERHQPCVSAQTVADTVYITRKIFQDSVQQKSIIENFFESFKILSVTKKQIRQAFSSPMADFEDAIQAFCAKNVGAKIIITRNIQDYKLSPVKAVTPKDFLQKFKC
ncbi:MAG: PIN domain-containing protein [Treponema sp.]|nr:PIN domain-containing protein [Treponema sp.]